MRPKMRLNTVAFEKVQAAIDKGKEQGRETDTYNTHLHSHEEITAAIPEAADIKHVKPDLEASHFHHWVDLIAHSQQIQEWHVLLMPERLVDGLIDAHASWVASSDDKLRSQRLEELVEAFPQTLQTYSPNLKYCRETAEILNGKTPWFIRLDICSAEDSERRHENGLIAEVKSAEDLLETIYSSKRAIRALASIQEGSAPGLARLFLLPYNPNMHPHNEFRVFCPPRRRHVSDAKTRELPSSAAISQYRWWSPYQTKITSDIQTDGEKVLGAAESICKQILSHATRDPELLDKLRVEGLTFDLFVAGDGSVRLLEINCFGAMSKSIHPPSLRVHLVTRDEETSYVYPRSSASFRRCC